MSQEQLDQQRLETINEARGRCLDVRVQSQMEASSNQISQANALRSYREALENFLIEIRPYRGRDQEAAAFWTGSKEEIIGRVVIPPPPIHSSKWWEDDALHFGDGVPHWVRDPQQVERKTNHSELEPIPKAEVRGLDDILNAPVGFRETFEMTVKEKYEKSVTKTATVTQPLPRAVLDKGLEWATEYCNHVNLDLDLPNEEDVDADPY